MTMTIDQDLIKALLEKAPIASTLPTEKTTTESDFLAIYEMHGKRYALERYGSGDADDTVSECETLDQWIYEFLISNHRDDLPEQCVEYARNMGVFDPTDDELSSFYGSMQQIPDGYDEYWSTRGVK